MGGREMEIVLLGGTSTRTGYYKVAGVFRIATELRRAGFTVQTLDRLHCCTDDYLADFLANAVTDATLFVGISTTMLQTSNADYSHNTDGYRFFGIEDARFRQLIEQIHAINPEVKIAIGGAQVDPVCTDSIQQFSDHIDFCIKGQGETAVMALANHLKYGDELATQEIDGFKFIDDKVYPVEDFDNLDIVYEANDAVVVGEATTLEVARGCVFKCKFCTYDLIGKDWGDMIKTRRCLVAELERNYEEYGITTYICSDDTLNDSLEKVQFLHSVFTSLSFRPTFSGYFRLDILAKYREQARLLKESGVWSMNFGIETMDKKAGALMGKGMGRERIKEALSFLKEEFNDEVILTANFITGLPGESLESIHETLDYLLEPDCPLHGSSFRPLNLSRHIKGYNSALFKEAEKFGYVIDEKSDYWSSPIMDYTKATEITNAIFSALSMRKNPNYKMIHTFYINRLLNIGYTKEQIWNMVRNQPTVDFSEKEIERRTQLKHDNYFSDLIHAVRTYQAGPKRKRRSKVIIPILKNNPKQAVVAWQR